PRPRGRAMLWLEARYQRVLAGNLRHRWIAPVVGLAVIASAVYPFGKVEKNFDTSQSELFVQVRYDFSEEMTLAGCEAVVDVVEAALDPHREEMKAQSVYSFWNDRWTMSRIYLEDGEANEENIARLRRLLPRLLPEIAGVTLEVEEQRQGWRHHGGGKRIGFQLVGEDTEVLMRLAEEAVARVEAVPGLLNVETRHQEAQQELHIQPDRDLVARYDVTPDQMAEVVGLTYRGRRLQRFRTEDGEREMRLTLDEQQTESLSQLQNLPLLTAEGEKVPLAAVADFVEKEGRENIQRDNRLTSIWVNARFEEGTSEQYMPLIEAALAGLEMPFGYRWTFGDWQQRRQEQSKEFLTNLLLALLLVFAVMAGLFESVRQALALMVSLPFALAGAVWTLFLTGTSFDQPAAIGLLLLIGIVVNNGIVMLEHINQYRRNGMDRTEAMLTGGRERLRPILMTAVTTLIGLVPIVVQKPSLGGVYYYSMALVIMGGLFVSTFLTSVLLPTTATLAEDGIGGAGRMIGRLLRVRGGAA
ncbi:efflux RND transporter permease subunit, partial [bacterium]|nr:efflux RND transporter permease subunit [bacterium]